MTLICGTSAKNTLAFSSVIPKVTQDDRLLQVRAQTPEHRAARRAKYAADPERYRARLRASRERQRIRLDREDSISCPICGASGFRMLYRHVHRLHGLSTREFQQQWPGIPMASETLRAIRRDQMEDRGLGAYWTRGRIIDALRTYVAKTGRAPAYHEWSRSRRGTIAEFSPRSYRPSAATVVRVFGTWGAAIEAADISPKTHLFKMYDVTGCCRRGHSLEDAYVAPNGQRSCRTCRRLSAASSKRSKATVRKSGPLNDLRKCPICGRSGIAKLATHLRSEHDMSRGEFVEQYPEDPLSYCPAGHSLVGARLDGRGNPVCKSCHTERARRLRAKRSKRG